MRDILNLLDNLLVEANLGAPEIPAAKLSAVPNPKTGTVTMDVAKAVEEVKAGKIDFKVDKYGIIHSSVGKVSFDGDKIRENSMELIQTLIKMKPSSAKGTYIKSVYLSSTMSPGIQIDAKTVVA